MPDGTDFTPDEVEISQPEIDNNLHRKSDDDFDPQENPQKSNWREKFRAFAGRTKEIIIPKPVPIDEDFTDDKLARILTKMRLDLPNGKPSGRMEQPITIPDVLLELNYSPNTGIGKTEWRQEYREAFDAMIDRLRNFSKDGVLEPSEGYKVDPDRQILAWVIKDPEALRTKGIPPQPQQ